LQPNPKADARRVAVAGFDNTHDTPNASSIRRGEDNPIICHG
jgi:hypothetical protein